MARRFGRKAGADDQFELVGLAVQQADGEMIEVHQLAREADDFFFQQLEALADVQFAHGVAFEADEFAAGLVDGVDFLLQAAGAGGVPDDRDHLHHLPAGIDHRAGDQFHVLLVFDVEGVTF